MYTVLVGGGHVSGKSHLVKDIISGLKVEAKGRFDLHIEVFDLGHYQIKPGCPDIDFEKLLQDLADFKNKKHTYAVSFVHGNYALYNEQLCEQSQLRIFLDTPPDVRLSQWILRDIYEGSGQELQDVLKEYLDNARPEFKRYIEATQGNADILLPKGSDPMNVEICIDGILNELQSKIDFRDTLHPSTSMANIQAEAASVHESHYYSNN